MKIRYIIISLLVVLSLVMSAGCELIPTIETAPEAPPSSPAASETEETTPIDSGWELSSLEGQASPLPTIADVVAKVKPSVVAINTEEVTYVFGRAFTQPAAGSGWIISEDGIIITNNHVVAGARSITVTLDDGRTFAVDMETVATDSLTDLAVLRIEVEEKLPAAKVGDSDRLKVGDWVVAIGNSLGEGIRATVGIVSRKDVKITVEEGQELYGLIETDAAINAGNSGGPLVNMSGEVIGITNAKAWNVSIGIEGVGYAIGSEEAMPIIQELINRGYVIRPWLGVGLYPLTDYVVWRYGLAVSEGVLITGVADDSPASEAGLKAGDVIVRFGDTEITNVPELTKAVHSSQIGEEVEITFWRGDTKQTAVIVPAESPPPQ